MLYIKLIEKNENTDDLKNKILNKLDYFFPKIKEKNINEKKLIEIYDINEKTKIKLKKYINMKCITRVCLSKNLLENKDFVIFLKNENIKILDGKWLFKYLILECINYICLAKKEILDSQEISILTNKLDETIYSIINQVAHKVRVLNIVTFNENRFKKLENQLYEKDGIVLNITNNYKSLKKSDIIFNFDFNEKEINKIKIEKNACIINLKENIKIFSKSFEGINVNNYIIKVPDKYLADIKLFEEFNPSILYESFIYKNTNYYNIRKELEKDNIEIDLLLGQNGKIMKNEFAKHIKKV